jgi:hypothetical protein
MARKSVSTQEIYDILAALLVWESQQGGYEARCWKEARRLRNRLRREIEQTPSQHSHE